LDVESRTRHLLER